jgi:radical SAM protein with 4Fe4S-binding SPASM domain
MKLRNFDFSKKVLLHPEQISNIKIGNRPFPLTVELDLTNHCNHRCSFCVWGEHIAVDKSSLEKETIKNCIQDMRDLGTKAITFTGGGEPMIHKNFFEILPFSKSLGLDCGLITNGSAITEKNCELLLNNLKWIRLSMSGGDKESYLAVQGKDHFELVCKNLVMLCKEKKSKQSDLKIGIRMLITKENLHTLIKLTNIICQMDGVDYLQIAPDHDNEDGGKFWHGDAVKEEINKAEILLKEKQITFVTSGFEILNTSKQNKDEILDKPAKCYAHFYQIAIMADGNVAFCKNARFDEKYSVGNINDNTIKEIWNSEKNKKFESWVRPNNCGLTCKNIRVNLGAEEILDANKKEDTILNKSYYEKLSKEYIKENPNDPLDINFVG